MRRLVLIAVAIAATAASLAAVAGADDARTYKVEMYNAFGIVDGSDVRIAGVNAGTVTDLDINERKRAVVTIELDGPLSRLGEDTTCASEPQSLIAEYFLDCEPEGPELPDGGTIPASQVTQTVQPDLVQSTWRDPFRRRFQIILNEFGTALAGNPDDLNEAIRLGAPALRQTKEVTGILADQNRTIRDLNVNSDTIMQQLSERRDDVVRFVQEARDTAQISNSRRENVSRNFEILDDFLAELRPTLAGLEELTREQTPLLRDLRRAAPHLERLTHDMPPFNRATSRSLNTLGPAARAGRRALTRGRDEIRLLARAGLNAPAVAEMLADFVSDLDDPRRATGIDQRAGRDTGRTGTRAGTRNTMGYTGLEGLLNYPFYFGLGTNTYDQIGHKLAINLYRVNTGECGAFWSGRDPETGETGYPREGSPGPAAETRDIRDAARCMPTLGPNQPGITELTDRQVPKYHPSVCPEGTYPEAARELICDPNDPAGAAARERAGEDSEPERRRASDGDGGDASGDDSTLPAPQSRGVPNGAIEDMLRIPRRLNDSGRQVRRGTESLRGTLGGALQGQEADQKKKKRGGGRQSGGGDRTGGGQAAKDLLDFLFAK